MGLRKTKKLAMQLRTFFPILLLLAGFAGYAQPLRVVQPRIENLTNPIGLDVIQPRFGWLLNADRRNVLQTAYELRVASNARDLATGKKLLWNSGKIQSDASVWVPYGGPLILKALM